MSTLRIALIASTWWISVSSSVVAQETHDHGAHESTTPAAPTQSLTSAERQSEAEHVAPDPPKHTMDNMPYREMADLMQMDDRKRFGRVLLDQLEWRTGEGKDLVAWEGVARYGGDYHKAVVKSEGEQHSGGDLEANVELLWERNFARWWSSQLGVRRDVGEGQDRTWAAIGIEGLAPYWFDVEATLYLGEEGRTAARLRAEYELLFTQRLILQPEFEINAYGKSDPVHGIGSGLSDAEIGLRLRYEFRREIAPYIGVNFKQAFGSTADISRAAGNSVSEVHFVAGLRLWF